MRMSERKFVIIDGSSLLSTCYYAVLPREIMFARTEEEKQKHYDKILHASDGTYTNGIFGVLKATVSLLKKQQPEYAAFVFDQTRDTFRRELYPEYKGTRSATPEPLKQQFMLLEELLKDVGFKVLYSSRFEADDYAGSLVMKFRDQVSVVVMTKDHDYLQLVNDEYNVRAWMVQSRQDKADELYDKYYAPYGFERKKINLPEKTFEFTADHVFGEEGVWPWQITDLKGIQGDASDHIPGVKGVASAAPLLLNEYGTVEGIYEAIHEAGQDKKALKALQDFWKNSLGITRSPLKSLTKTGEGEELCAEGSATLSKELATIKTDIPIDLGLEDFSVSCYDEARMRGWCSRLDIREESIFGK